MWPWSRPRALWQRGEDAAYRHLKREGYRILARNVRLGRNEVDIIARKGDTVVFVEVRTRAAEDAVPPEDSIGPQKQARIKKAAALYIARHDDPGAYYRFDVVAVILPSKGPATLTHLVDAFH